jgi:peptidoglycan/LPS O-acetylase OafA/YrhL
VAVILCLHLGGPDLLTVALFAVLILATVGNSGRSALILNFAPFTWLGDISYSLYLIHSFVQFLTTRLLEAIGVYDRAHLTAGVSLVLMLVMVSVCLICASTTYFGVEIVWRKYVRRAFGSARSATAYSAQLLTKRLRAARAPSNRRGWT